MFSAPVAASVNPLPIVHVPFAPTAARIVPPVRLIVAVSVSGLATPKVWPPWMFHCVEPAFNTAPFASVNPLLNFTTLPARVKLLPGLSPMVTLSSVPELTVNAVPPVVTVPLANVPVTVIPPLPVLRRLMLPVVLRLPATEIAAAALGTVAPASRADKVMLPPPVVIELPPLMVMLPPARNVTSLPTVWLVRLSATPALSVMFCCACRTMLPVSDSSVPLLMVESAPAPSVNRICPSASCGSWAPLPANPAAMTMLLGSSSRVPSRPLAARVSTRPRKISAPLPEVSTNPPSPPSLPPRAKMLARKLVASSAHTTTLPPLPLSSASALMTTASPT